MGTNGGGVIAATPQHVGATPSVGTSVNMNGGVPGNSSMSASFVQQGFDMFHSKDYATAVLMFTLAIGADPLDTTLLFHRANAHFEIGNLESAQRDLATFLSQVPMTDTIRRLSVPAAFLQARIAFLQGRPNDTLDLLSEVLRNFDKYPPPAVLQYQDRFMQLQVECNSLLEARRLAIQDQAVRTQETGFFLSYRNGEMTNFLSMREHYIRTGQLPCATCRKVFRCEASDLRQASAPLCAKCWQLNEQPGGKVESNQVNGKPSPSSASTSARAHPSPSQLPHAASSAPPVIVPPIRSKSAASTPLLNNAQLPNSHNSLIPPNGVAVLPTSPFGTSAFSSASFMSFQQSHQRETQQQLPPASLSNPIYSSPSPSLKSSSPPLNPIIRRSSIGSGSNMINNLNSIPNEFDAALASLEHMSLNSGRVQPYDETLLNGAGLNQPKGMKLITGIEGVPSPLTPPSFASLVKSQSPHALMRSYGPPSIQIAMATFPKLPIATQNTQSLLVPVFHFERGYWEGWNKSKPDQGTLVSILKSQTSPSSASSSSSLASSDECVRFTVHEGRLSSICPRSSLVPGVAIDFQLVVRDGEKQAHGIRLATRLTPQLEATIPPITMEEANDKSFRGRFIAWEGSEWGFIAYRDPTISPAPVSIAVHVHALNKNVSKNDIQSGALVSFTTFADRGGHSFAQRVQLITGNDDKLKLDDSSSKSPLLPSTYHYNEADVPFTFITDQQSNRYKGLFIGWSKNKYGEILYRKDGVITSIKVHDPNGLRFASKASDFTPGSIVKFTFNKERGPYAQKVYVVSEDESRSVTPTTLMVDDKLKSSAPSATNSNQHSPTMTADNVSTASTPPSVPTVSPTPNISPEKPRRQSQSHREKSASVDKSTEVDAPLSPPFAVGERKSVRRNSVTKDLPASSAVANSSENILGIFCGWSTEHHGTIEYLVKLDKTKKILFHDTRVRKSDIEFARGVAVRFDLFKNKDNKVSLVRIHDHAIKRMILLAPHLSYSILDSFLLSLCATDLCSECDVYE